VKSLAKDADEGAAPEGFTSIFNGKDLTGWKEPAGSLSKFTVTKDGELNVKNGKGTLESDGQFGDFVLQLECISHAKNLNSGIFLRCQNPAVITDENCYEANIFDQRPDPTYGTGAIVKVAAVSPMPKAGGKWNTYEITARGKRLTLVLNGVKTVDVEDGKLASGPIALQWGRGTIKFRKVEITPL